MCLFFSFVTVHYNGSLVPKSLIPVCYLICIFGAFLVFISNLLCLEMPTEGWFFKVNDPSMCIKWVSRQVGVYSVQLHQLIHLDESFNASCSGSNDPSTGVIRMTPADGSFDALSHFRHKFLIPLKPSLWVGYFFMARYLIKVLLRTKVWLSTYKASKSKLFTVLSLNYY